MKETAASYKLDFKYTFKEGRMKDMHYTLSEFSRKNRYYDHRSSFDAAIMERLKTDNPDIFAGADHNAICAVVDATPEMAEVELAFQKWLKRREPVINAWNDYVKHMSDESKLDYWERKSGPMNPNTPITLMNVANAMRLIRFRQMLETSRPYNLPIGSAVELADKYKNSRRYDPYYWGEHRHKPRVGTIVKYVDDVSGKGGTGSRMIQVMFFADGTIKNIPERGLMLYDHSTSTNTES